MILSVNPRSIFSLEPQNSLSNLKHLLSKFLQIIRRRPKMNLNLFLGCFNGPRVTRKYRDPISAVVDNNFQPSQSSTSSSAGAYRSNFLEDNCSTLVSIIETFWTIAIYTSPFWAYHAAVRRSILFGMSPEFALKFALGVGFVYGGAYLGRGLGRAMNKDYLEFLQILFAASTANSSTSSPRDHQNLLSLKSSLRNLRKYDFDFRYWPVDYEWANVNQRPGAEEAIRDRRYLPEFVHRKETGFVRRYVLDGLAYVVAKTVAIRLAYPGTLGVIQSAVAPALDQGRTKLVEEMGGRRSKLRTSTGNEIDTMFVDRRNDWKYPNGNVLVITCEGNGGFYEVGSSATPLEAKYSVLMWNHPGFGGSTGRPWPREEAAAIDVVVQFATERLGWNETDIVMYGWSIGGFSSTWITMNYPNIRAIILDATFDDILPLALHTMPSSWAPLVERTIRRYLNLHIEQQLEHYFGPVTLIRRLKDEVMAAVEGVNNVSEMRRVNRANNLLKKLLIDRYPNVFRDAETRHLVDEWVAATDSERIALYARHAMSTRQCRNILNEYVQKNHDQEEVERNDRGAPLFPLLVGDRLDLEVRNQMALYLSAHYMDEFDSTHCIPLPAEKFIIPKHPWE